MVVAVEDAAVEMSRPLVKEQGDKSSLGGRGEGGCWVVDSTELLLQSSLVILTVYHCTMFFVWYIILNQQGLAAVFSYPLMW